MANGRKWEEEPSRAMIERLLAESEVLRRRSEELASEVRRLHEELVRLEGRKPERRRRPRMKGK